MWVRFPPPAYTYGIGHFDSIPFLCLFCAQSSPRQRQVLGMLRMSPARFTPYIPRGLAWGLPAGLLERVWPRVKSLLSDRPAVMGGGSGGAGGKVRGSAFSH